MNTHTKTGASTPIPHQLEHLDRDVRGYPIPWIVMRGVDGRPYFTINDHERVKRCALEGLCGITGKRIVPGPPDESKPDGFTESGYWFIGGPLSFHTEMGAFLDPPMTFHAAEYALRACPYLAVKHYNAHVGSVHAKQAKDSSNLPPGMATVDVTKPHPITGELPHVPVDRRPDVFLLGRADDVNFYSPAPGHIMFKPVNLTHTFMWRHGEPLPRSPENDALLVETIRVGWQMWEREMAERETRERDSQEGEESNA